MALYCGIDLHSNNSVIAVVDDEDRVVMEKRLPNDLGSVLAGLSPLREELVACVVETTYNWYWLVDGLMAHGFDVRLAHTAAITQYSGLKYANDHTDARHLAHLLRLGILPEGYIYPSALRGTRDLLRRRMLLVQQSTLQLLSLQSLVSRQTGRQMNGAAVKQLCVEDINTLFSDAATRLCARSSLRAMKHLDGLARNLERHVLGSAPIQDDYRVLTSIKGVGEIIGLTIALETGDIGRFATPGRYASYARCVKSERTSNGKKKGQSNVRNGNRYLHWAFMEAAHHAIRWNPKIKSYYERKRRKVHVMSAKKAVANKLSRACYHMLKDRTTFDAERAFA